MRDMYLTSKEKIDLSVEVAKRERELLSHIDYETDTASMWEFRSVRPPASTVPSPPTRSARGKRRFISTFEALFKELDYVAEKMKGRTLDTVYFGGGTPTSFKGRGTGRPCSQRSRIPLTSQRYREFTVEAGRPDSITEDKFKVLRAHNISRISINPQTMKQATLDLIGRHHTVDMVKEKFRMARDLGF